MEHQFFTKLNKVFEFSYSFCFFVIFSLTDSYSNLTYG